jgi:rhodanese-related sulfurtransferase
MNPERPFRNALLLVLVGAALGIGSNVLHPNPIPWKPVKRTMATLDDPAGGNPGAPGTAGQAEAAEHDVSGDPPSEGESPAAAPAEKTGGPAAPDFKPMKDGFGGAEAVPKTDLYADLPESEFPVEVHTAKAKELYDRGGLLVLDARERSEYEEGHIAGAVNADADKVVADLPWMEKTAADPRPILVYCDGGDCELSMDLGFEIARTGHRRVLVYQDGFPAWKDAGYPVDTGDTP